MLRYKSLRVSRPLRAVAEQHEGQRFLAAGMLALACSAGLILPDSSAYGRPASRGHLATLSARVVGLPPGTAARIVVRGPHFSRVLHGSRTLRRLRPGRYVLTVRKVKIARRVKGVRAGSVALPSEGRLFIRLKAGQTLTVHVAYGTIVNANVRRLETDPVSVRGDPADPSELVLPASVRARAGTILTAKPSVKLPAGLFHRVTATRRSGRRIVLKLVPARLVQAFPELDIDAHPHLVRVGAATTGTSALTGSAIAGNLGPVEFRCQSPLTGSQLAAGVDLDVDPHVELHIPTSFGIPIGLPHGEISLTLKGSATLQALIPEDAGCSASLPVYAWVGWMIIGDVALPVYFEASIGGSLLVHSDLEAKAAASMTLKLGIAFDGAHIENVSAASSKTSASAKGAGTISVGPKVRFAVGAQHAADVHFDASPTVAFTAATDGSCSLDLVGLFDVGISFGPFELNQHLPTPTYTFYRCPTGHITGTTTWRRTESYADGKPRLTQQETSTTTYVTRQGARPVTNGFEWDHTSVTGSGKWQSLCTGDCAGYYLSAEWGADNSPIGVVDIVSRPGITPPGKVELFADLHDLGAPAQWTQIDAPGQPAQTYQRPFEPSSPIYKGWYADFHDWEITPLPTAPRLIGAKTIDCGATETGSNGHIFKTTCTATAAWDLPNPYYQGPPAT